MMTTRTLDVILQATEGRFVTVSFIKDNGELRTITGRIGARHKGVKASHRMDSAEREFFLLYSMRDRGFRRIDAQRVVSVQADGLYIFNEGLIKSEEAAA